MSQEDGGRRKRRNAGSRNKLRRFNNIESVIVEEPFSLTVPDNTSAALKSEAGIKEGNAAGDGYYVSATNNTSRYYGLLVSKEALKAASYLHFQEEAQSLDLNRRMKTLKERRENESKGGNGDADDVTPSEPQLKRRKVEETPLKIEPGSRTIQKFQYVPATVESDTDPGYRILVASFVNVEAASEGDEKKRESIEKSCSNGGGFVGHFYYQFESMVGRLNSRKEIEKKTDVGLRTSLGFHTFLQESQLPIWFPLSNLQISQHKVLSMLQMKRNSKGNVVWNENSTSEGISSQGTHAPMEKRAHFRVGVIGGGISGLACAKELLRLGEEKGINIDVVLLEGRSRLGGRLLTDDSTFSFEDGSSFPVDLGASWIHGIDHNPLAVLAKEANIDFVTASEEVKMIRESLKPVNSEVDEYMGKLLDTLLDQAADDVWESEDYVADGNHNQQAVRWYAQSLDNPSSKELELRKIDAPLHRRSSDVSIDYAIGKAVAKHNHREFRKFGPQEHSLLLWNTKNIEYALGANISDLSMKFWDSDERHAFEGDHVLLKQGYSAVVRHMEHQLQKHGDKFKCELGFNVGKIEYARRSTTTAYPTSLDGRDTKFAELSDSCCVSNKDGSRSEKFDFVVSTLPLGVMKQSVEAAKSTDNDEKKAGIIFDPPLPFAKVDAILSTGFGLLNKVYLQFPKAFWRMTSILDEDHTLFGNASGFNPHHYMFFDVGKSLGKDDDKPPILMTLISGKEAVECERMNDQELVNQVVATLRRLFTPDMVPEPTSSKVTRWGADEYSRGCYTFLPPGATEQDFQILQSPINGNGDSLMLEGSETMRLFWAGEHTTALHPSMAHGALLSGFRAAKEVMSTISFKYNDDASGFEKLIPLAIFRKKNPTAKLQCSLCHLVGSRVREGSLLALQKGARQVLVHNNCGENSPEVEVRDGKWRDVIKAVNRGKQINCCMCGSIGATIGCSDKSCFRCFHFSCAEDTGWRFNRDGKIYFCDLHRGYDEHGDNECDQVSLKFYKSKRPNETLRCCLCTDTELGGRRGKMLAFSQQFRLLSVHDRCARYTTLTETLDDYTTMSDTAFKNLFHAQKRAKHCNYCSKEGATVVCSDPSCNRHYHFTCAEDDAGWNFQKKGIQFKCQLHRKTREQDDAKPSAEKSEPKSEATVNGTQAPPSLPAGLFQHNLFFSGAERVANGGHASAASAKMDVAVNDKSWERNTTKIREANAAQSSFQSDTDGSSSVGDDDDDDLTNPLLMPLSCSSLSTQHKVMLKRASMEDPWSFGLLIGPDYASNKNSLLVELKSVDRPEGVSETETMVVQQIDEKAIGTEGMRSLQEILAILRSTTEITLTIGI